MAILEEIVEDGSISGLANTGDRVAASSDTKPLTKFTIFPKLPPEMRIKIWKFTFTPRTLSVAIKFESQHSFKSYLRRTGEPVEKYSFSLHDWDSRFRVRYCENNELPVALFVCWESRLATLKCYELLFESPPIEQIIFSPKMTLRGIPFYFNADIDTLTFANSHSSTRLKTMAADVGDAITKVKIHRCEIYSLLAGIWNSSDGLVDFGKMGWFFLLLSGLEKLDLVIPFKNGHGVDEATQIRDDMLLSFIFNLNSESEADENIWKERFKTETLGDLRRAIVTILEEERAKDLHSKGKAELEVNFILEPARR